MFRPAPIFFLPSAYWFSLPEKEAVYEFESLQQPQSFRLQTFHSCTAWTFPDLSARDASFFSAQAYRTATKGTQQNNNLYTASSYISVKFHQHDSSQSIFTDTVDGSPALCMTDTVNDQQYITYIYLKEQHLKELFTAAGNTPSAQMGTNIASLSDFQIQQETDGFYRITLKDPDGNTSSLLLHSGFGNNSF